MSLQPWNPRADRQPLGVAKGDDVAYALALAEDWKGAAK